MNENVSGFNVGNLVPLKSLAIWNSIQSTMMMYSSSNIVSFAVIFVNCFVALYAKDVQSFDDALASTTDN